MDPEPEQVTFNEAYRALWQPLPASQRREAVKRLIGRRKDPLPIESLGDEHPDIEACLTRLSEAYDRKKVRCAKTSAQRRFLKKTADAKAETAETETAETAEPVADTVAAATAPAAEIVAVSEAEPEPTPAPAPAPEPAPEPEPKGAKPLQPPMDLEGPPKPARTKKAARSKPAAVPVEPPAPVDTPPAPVDTPPAQAPQKARSLLSKRGAPRRVDPASSVGRPLIERR